MFVVPLTSEPNQNFRCTIPVNGQNITFDFTMRYNSEAEYWIMGITNAVNGQELISDIPLIAGAYPAANLLEQFEHLRIGAAVVVKINPDNPDDEVIILFNDMCLDAWWQSGGEQTQLETRRHDLSDAMCFLGITSVPRAVGDYSTNSVMLRNEDKDSYFEIVDDEKTLNVIGAGKLNITTQDDINVTTNANLNVKSAANITIESDSNITIRAAGNMDLEAGGNMSLRAARIDLNQ